MVEFASAVMPIDDDPRANTIHFDFPQSEPSGPMRRAIRRDRFFRDYAVLIIGTLLWGLTMMAGCIITGIIVRHNTETRVREEDRQMYEQAIADYQAAQAESEQAKYWLSGEASLEAQINAEATDLCRAGWIWTTDEAFLTFCCNVWMRTLSPLYPGSVAEVLRQEGQYDFFSETAPVDEGRHEKAVELLKKLHEGVLPSHLTVNHLYLEMRDDGAICILHTVYPGQQGLDDPWRYK